MNMKEWFAGYGMIPPYHETRPDQYVIHWYDQDSLGEGDDEDTFRAYHGNLEIYYEQRDRSSAIDGHGPTDCVRRYWF